jgi:peptidoglycan/LPS O-acetylase OafA/YrhL
MLERLAPWLAPEPENAETSRIGYLDGWRAIAVGLVVMAHTLSVYGIKILPFGVLGVYLFFGISGYIITRLLVLEHLTAGRIDIGGFYIRRVARILPPLVVFLAAMLLLVPDPQLPWQAARSLAFTCNLGFEGGCTRLLEHTWSLAFEEQFYLVYPLLLAGLWRWWLIPLVGLWVLPMLVPVPFVGSFGFVRIATIMLLGAAFAAFEVRLAEVLRRLPLALLLAIEPSLPQKLLGAAVPFAAALTLFVLPRRSALLLRLLENGVLTRIGLYSYTFYLWQQFFSYPWRWNKGAMPVIGIIAGLALAALSYHTLESYFRGLARRAMVNRRQSTSLGVGVAA